MAIVAGSEDCGKMLQVIIGAGGSGVVGSSHHVRIALLLLDRRWRRRRIVRTLMPVAAVAVQVGSTGGSGVAGDVGSGGNDGGGNNEGGGQLM